MDITEWEVAEGIILESVLEGLADYYSKELAQKIRRGQRESALKGRALGSGVPLGYVIGEDKSFVVDEGKARFVRMIFEMYIAGKSNADICLEDSVPAIIDKDVFYMAQRETERRKTSKAVRSARAEYALSDKLFCGPCGRKMIGVSGTGRTEKYFYYYCPDARTKGECEKRQVRVDKLELAVAAETARMVSDRDIVKEIAGKSHALQLREYENDDERKYFEKRLAECRKAIENISRAIETGSVTEALPARLAELEAERKVLEGELAHIKKTRVVMTPEQIEFMILALADPKEEEDLDAYRRRIIDGFINSVRLFDGRVVVFYNFMRGAELATSELDFIGGDDGIKIGPPAECGSTGGPSAGGVDATFTVC